MSAHLVSVASRRRAYRPDVLGALAGFSLGMATFTAIHVALFVHRAAPLDAAERGWAALGVALVAVGILNASWLRRVLAAPRGPGAPPRA